MTVFQTHTRKVTRFFCVFYICTVCFHIKCRKLWKTIFWNKRQVFERMLLHRAANTINDSFPCHTEFVLKFADLFIFFAFFSTRSHRIRCFPAIISCGCQVFAYVGIAQYIEEDPRLRGFSEQIQNYGFPFPCSHILAANTLPNNVYGLETLWGSFNSLLATLPKEQKLGIFC